MKSRLKQVARTSFIVAVLPFFFLYKAFSLFGGEKSFSGFSQFFSLFPGKFGCYFRAAFYHLTMHSCSQNVVIGFGTLFSQFDTEISDRVYIGPQCNIGMCSIGEDTLIASGVHIMSGSNQHNFSDLDTPIQQQGGEYQKVRIGADSWIGNGSLIMANVGDKCIVGAGSVVIKNVPDLSIVAGNPAKLIRTRKGIND